MNKNLKEDTFKTVPLIKAEMICTSICPHCKKVHETIFNADQVFFEKGYILIMCVCKKPFLINFNKGISTTDRNVYIKLPYTLDGDYIGDTESYKKYSLNPNKRNY